MIKDALLNMSSTATYPTTPVEGGIVDPYRPSSFVQNLHAHQFALTSAYAGQVVGAPATLFALGLLSLVFLNCGLLLRRCFRWLRGLPILTPSVEKPEEFINYQRIAVVVFFNAFLILALLMNFLSFIGNGQIDAAIVHFQDGMDQFQSLFSGLKRGATDVAAMATTLQNDFFVAKGSTCPSVWFLQLKITSFATNAQTLLSSVASVDANLALIIATIKADATKYKNAVFYVLWLLALVTIALLKGFQILRKRRWVKCAMGIAMFTFVLEITACFVFMVAASVFADMCIAPSNNIISVFPVGNNANYSAQDAIKFYATCTGRNVVGEEISDTWASIRTINNSLRSLTNSTSARCRNDANIAVLLRDVAKVGVAFQPIADVTRCGGIQQIWFTLVNQTLCTDLFNGFYGLWLTQLLTSFFIYFAVIMASVSYQYYDMPVEIVDADAVVMIGAHKATNVDFSMVVPIFESPEHTHAPPPQRRNSFGINPRGGIAVSPEVPAGGHGRHDNTGDGGRDGRDRGREDHFRDRDRERDRHLDDRDDRDRDTPARDGDRDRSRDKERDRNDDRDYRRDLDDDVEASERPKSTKKMP